MPEENMQNVAHTFRHVSHHKCQNIEDVAHTLYLPVGSSAPDVTPQWMESATAFSVHYQGFAHCEASEAQNGGGVSGKGVDCVRKPTSNKCLPKRINTHVMYQNLYIYLYRKSKQETSANIPSRPG